YFAGRKLKVAEFSNRLQNLIRQGFRPTHLFLFTF
ncbi:MAG: hypothetical protein ACJAZV_001870, partial [Roseivirga sp.]